MPLLGQRGLERWKDWGFHTWEPGDSKQQAEQGVRGQGTHIAGTEGTVSFKAQGHRAAALQEGADTTRAHLWRLGPLGLQPVLPFFQ